MGKPGFPISQPLLGAADAPTGRGMGKPGFPFSQPRVGAAGAPSGRGVGKPGFPMPQPRFGAAGAPSGRGVGKPGFPAFSPPMRLRRTTPKYYCFWEGEALPNPPRWRVISWEGFALPTPPAGGLFSPQTPIRGAHNAAMTMGRLREGRPLPGPPPLGEGTGRLPAGRGSGKPGFPVFSPQAPCAGRTTSE